VASVNAPLATSGFVGALTSLIVGTTDRLIPDSNLKSLISVAAGMFAALLWFGIMSWFVVLRLRATKRSLDSILPQFEQIQAQLQIVIERQMEAMRQQNASQQQLRELDKERTDLSASIARAMIEITRKSLDVVRSLST